MEAQPVQPPPPPVAEMGALSRIANVFFAPAKTFESIARKPGWVLPVVILLIITVTAGAVIGSKLDMDAAIEKQLEKSGRDLTPDQMEKAKSTSKVVGKFIPVTAGIFVILQILIVPALWHGIAAAFGKATKYAAAFGAYVHVQMIPAVKGLLALLVALPRDKIDQAEAQGLLKSNLGAFLDPETTAKPLLALANNIDVFEIWALLLGILAITRVTRLSKNTAILVVVGLWVVWILVQVGGAAIGAAFGG